jgi:hypothetical protein
MVFEGGIVTIDHVGDPRAQGTDSVVGPALYTSAGPPYHHSANLHEMESALDVVVSLPAVMNCGTL